MAGDAFDDPHLAPRAANHVPLTPLDFLSRTLAVHPDRPAIAWNEHLWTYAEFGRMVDRMAHWLKGQGIGPSDVVSVMLGNRPEMLAAHYAIPALGAILNCVNTRLSAEDVAFILDHAGAKLLICDKGTRPAFDTDPTPVSVLCSSPGDGTGLDFYSGEAPILDLTAEIHDEWQKIGLNYTSGTTGRHLLSGHATVVDESGARVSCDGVTPGEITLKGNTVMAGYYRNPQATEEAFQGGRFHTGDIAVTHPDGQIEIRDRAKDVIITGGENVSSLEIETVLHRHPDVLFAAVVAAPHPKWGETPWAFIETKEGRRPADEELDRFCRAHLSGFKRPRRFVLGELPRTATGKIQKYELRSRARAMLGDEGHDR